MSEPPLPIAHVAAARRRAQPPQAKIYLRLLWALPGIAMLWLGLYRIGSVEDNGPVNSIQLTTKEGLVGQASEAIRLVEPGNPDLYLKVTIAGRSEPLRTPTRTDTPVGNGLAWELDPPVLMRDIRQVDVWDADLIRDNHKDHVTMGAWRAQGQTYGIELLGSKYAPPNWALPVAITGAAIALLVFLRFVWDQVI
jgi:hypothetical protein